MEVTVSQNILAKELAIARRMVETKMTIPMLSHVLIEARGSTLRLTGTDLTVGYRSSFRAEIEQEGAIALPTKRLTDYVRLLPNAMLRISCSASHRVTLSCGRAMSELSGTSPQGFPDLEEMPEPAALVPCAMLLRGIPRAVISIAEEKSHYALAGAKVSVGSETVSFVSTDGHRLSLYAEGRDSGGVGPPHFDALVSRRALNDLHQVVVLATQGQESGQVDEEDPEAEGPGPQMQVAVSKNNVFFRIGPRLFLCRRMTGKFPNHTRVMPKELSINLEMGREIFRAALQRVAQFTETKGRTVQFLLADGKLQMKAANSAWGSGEESLRVDYDGEPVEIGFNVDYILEFLAVSESETILFRLRGARGAAQLNEPGMGKGMERDYRYVIMPIHI